MNRSTAAEPLLAVRNLSVSIRLGDGRRGLVVDDLSFELPAGGTLGLVGESGSGKSMTSLAIMGLLPPTARVEAGQILLDGEDMLTKSPAELRRLRGRRISMILQDPMTALDPSFTIGYQLAQPLRRHRRLRGRQLRDAMAEALEQVELSAADDRLQQYPHQLSGGMRQRVTSAIALAGNPALLIADEPTTALDATTQARYMKLLRELQDDRGFSLLLIAHDLHLVRHVCKDVVVLYASQVMERGRVDDVFDHPEHPYSRALIGAIPTLGSKLTLESIDGQAPDASEQIVGCRFADRCRHVREVCREQVPPLSERPRSQTARCWGTEPNGWIEQNGAHR